MSRRSLDRVINDAANFLRQYFEEGQHNTDLLRSAATNVVELRSRFTRGKDGVTDWSGRTSEYREAIRDVYGRAGLTNKQVDTLQRKFAYHVRHALEARVPLDELEAVGFKDEDRITRQARKRTTDSAIAAVISPDTNAASRVVFAERLLAQATTENLADLSAKQRGAVAIALTNIDTHAEKLRGAVKAADARRFG